MLREYREYERWSTTVVNAYVTPIMGAYLGALETRLAGDRFAVMQSNGGRLSAGAAKAAAVRTILSGPAAGAVGARAVAEAAGHPRVIGFDMGGTSTDVCLIDGAIPTTSDTIVGDFPVRLPVIDIHSVGLAADRCLRRQRRRASAIHDRASPTPTCCSAASIPGSSWAAA